jgi:hypothetical protein
MGYQEFALKTSKESLKRDFEKLKELSAEKPIQDEAYCLPIVATLKENVRLYDFNKNPDDWRIQLEKGDLFLIVVGDRTAGRILMDEFSRLRPHYGVDTIVRCIQHGNDKTVYDPSRYNLAFKDTDINDFLKERKNKESERDV